MQQHSVYFFFCGPGDNFTIVKYFKIQSVSNSGRLVMGRRKKSSRQKSPFVSCVFCDQVLASYTTLQGHINSHTGERPYFCEHCDATFGSASGLIAHTNNIHLRLKYECPKCGREFNAPSNLCNHRKKCTGRVLEHVKRDIGKSKGNRRKATKVTRDEDEGVEKVKKSFCQTTTTTCKDAPNGAESQVKVEVKLEKDISTVKNTSDPIKQSPNQVSPEPILIPFQPLDLNIFASILIRKQQEVHRRWDPSFFLHLNRYDPQESCFSPSYPPKRDEATAPIPSQKLVMFPPKVRQGHRPKNSHTSNSFHSVKLKIGASSQGKPKPVNQELNGDDSSHKCLQCNKNYSTKWNLLKHQKIHVNDKRFVCHFCGKRFIEKCNVVRHIAHMHQSPEDPDPTHLDKSKTRCGFCGETYPGDIARLFRHISFDHHALLIIPEPPPEQSTTTILQKD